MERQKRPFVMLLVSLVTVMLTTLLAAQGPPNPCANACWQAYLNTVKACHGDAACLAAARAQAEACIQGCYLTPPR